MVFLEAAACGLPVVAGRSGGSVDAVLDGETGHLVDGRDVEPGRRHNLGPARPILPVRRRWEPAAGEWVSDDVVVVGDPAPTSSSYLQDGLAVRSASSGVERRDLGGVVLEDDVALDLQRRGEMAVLDGPVVAEDPERLDRLGL